MQNAKNAIGQLLRDENIGTGVILQLLDTVKKTNADFLKEEVKQWENTINGITGVLSSDKAKQLLKEYKEVETQMKKISEIDKDVKVSRSNASLFSSDTALNTQGPEERLAKISKDLVQISNEARANKFK